MKNEFEVAFKEIAELRGLSQEVVLEALRGALVSAYRRDNNAGNAQHVEATIDPNTLRPRIFVEKEVVDEVMNPGTEVTLEKARYYDPSAQYGDLVMVQVEGSTKKFGRIAAQTAKQVILQKIREAERNSLFDEFSEREGDVVTGVVQSVSASSVTLSLGRTEAVLPRNQQIPGEKYKPHDKVRVFVMEVKRGNRGPHIVVSRSHRNMLRRLLEYEVPEIYSGQVEIKNIAREAGYRSKVAVSATQEGIDPVGACVGMRGVRIQNIVKELHDEKIDVIEWSLNQEKFIEKALSPARVTGVYLEDDPDAGRTAVVVVPDDQLSLAIGREGQNARLAAKLTGWRIDIKSVTEAVQDALKTLDNPIMANIRVRRADLVTDVERVMDKKQRGLTIQPEDFQTLGKFADLAERAQLAAREALRENRLNELNAVRATLPQQAFEMPVSSLPLSEEILEALQPLDNVGEIMVRFLVDEDRLRRLLKDLPPQTLDEVQVALDRLVLPEEAFGITAPDTPRQAAAAGEVAAETPPDTQPEAQAASTASDAVMPAFGDAAAVEPVKARPGVEEVTASAPQPVYTPPAEAENEDEEEDEDSELKPSDKKKGKKGKKGRQLVFDENTGRTVAKRQRKGSRRRDDWDDYLD